MKTEEEDEPRIQTIGGNCAIYSQIVGKDEQSMKNGDAEDKFGEMSINLARHNLEVTLKRTKEQCFRVAKEMALESAKGARKMDAFVRSQLW